jgi:C1A family cysteine protease
VRTKRYGWVPDAPDERDHAYAAPLSALGGLPAAVDLRPKGPPVYSQGDLNSCTANAIAAAIQFERQKQGLPDIMPSRLFIYYNERAMEGQVDTDSGAQIRDGIKSVAKQGVCPEADWPYDQAKFSQRPPDSAYRDALRDRAVSYERVARDLEQMRGCLASGCPFVLGLTAYPGFESPDVRASGCLPMPAAGERRIGLHAVIAVGYDDAEQRLLVRNSWGPDWGQQGCFTLPYAYVMEPKLARDFWTIRLVGA